MNDEELAAEARRIAPQLRGTHTIAVDLYAAGLLRQMADRLDGRPAERPPGRCGDHHASGVTSCTLQAGHDGAHHNGSGLTWGGDLPGEEE